MAGGAGAAGGGGGVLGALRGALTIPVLRNGMNLTSVEPYRQKGIPGLVSLGAVLLDAQKRKGWWTSGVVTWSSDRAVGSASARTR